MPSSLLIELKRSPSDYFITLSGDPDSEDELPDQLDLIVNHEAQRYFVKSIQDFLESIPNLEVEVFVPTGRQWFGFVLSGAVDLDLIKQRFQEAFRGGEYRILEMAWGSEELTTTSLTNLLEEMSLDQVIGEEPSVT